MESKIIFLYQEQIHSNKKNQDYFIVCYLLNKKPVTAFVTQEVYDKIRIKNLQYLKEYTGIFTVNTTSRGLDTVLFDIK